MALAALMALAGCKADLYSNLTEQEANEMMAVLMSNDITADKRGLGDSFTLRVEEKDMVTAINLLTGKGYPRTQRQSIGSVFQKSGIISSPFEERVRYIYALGEEVAQTLSQIDGVVTARVHVVVPEDPQLGQPLKPASAAVFIKHEPEVDLEFLVPQIRRLVSSSIEGLDQLAVTVVLTEALVAMPSGGGQEQRLVTVVPGLAIDGNAVGYFWTLVYAAAAAVVVLLAGAVLATAALFRSRRRGRPAAADAGADPALEPS